MLEHSQVPLHHQSKVFNRKLSTELYAQLMFGKMINRRQCLEGKLISNPQFEELANNFDQYRALYELIGYELVMRDGFAFIRTAEVSEIEKDDIARSFQGLLLVLFRGVMELGYTMDILLKDEAGLSDMRIEEIGKGQDKVEVLIACGMKSGNLVEHVKKLEARSVAYRNTKGCLVLTEAGTGFFQDLLGEGDLVI
ncbi:TPA: hypothetical protein ACNH47_001641 [Pseudomonas aeruginosa]